MLIYRQDNFIWSSVSSPQESYCSSLFFCDFNCFSLPSCSFRAPFFHGLFSCCLYKALIIYGHSGNRIQTWYIDFILLYVISRKQQKRQPATARRQESSPVQQQQSINACNQSAGINQCLYYVYHIYFTSKCFRVSKIA